MWSSTASYGHQYIFQKYTPEGTAPPERRDSLGQLGITTDTRLSNIKKGNRLFILFLVTTQNIAILQKELLVKILIYMLWLTFYSIYSPKDMVSNKLGSINFESTDFIEN